MTIGWRLLTAVALLAGAADLAGADVVRRYALVAGANQGGPDRPTLRYAVSDAARFATVLQELGGVEERDTILLEQPTVGALENALATLRERTESDRRDPAGAPRRTEFLFYYSGHADEKGLLLGEDRYSYRSLRDQMDAVPADVRIAVLDACASGAITRLKGGKRRPPFLADESSDMRGHAFLTSSSEDEVAQESEGLGGSFFTHYLTSGLRGAADVSGEGKVTLNEAYQFAFHETLGGTTDTRGGAQHPAYDIQLSGTGDVVMTDVRQTTAGLVLSEGLTGRCFVRNSEEQLLVSRRAAEAPGTPRSARPRARRVPRPLRLEVRGDGRHHRGRRGRPGRGGARPDGGHRAPGNGLPRRLRAPAGTATPRRPQPHRPAHDLLDGGKQRESDRFRRHRFDVRRGVRRRPRLLPLVP
jgi:uncharacterized caspase-like protein